VSSSSSLLTGNSPLFRSKSTSSLLTTRTFHDDLDDAGLGHGAKEPSEKSVDRLCRLARFPSAPCRISGRGGRSPAQARNDAEEVAKDGCLHLWRKAAAAGGLRRLSRSLPQCRRLDRYASGPSCRHAGLPLPSAAGPRVGGADRRVSRPSAPPRRADYPCADHFAQTRRRRRQRSESGVAAGLPTLRG